MEQSRKRPIVTALVGVGAAAFFTTVAAVVKRAPASLLNIPNADYWTQPKHLARMRQLAPADARMLGSWAVLFLTCVNVLIVRASDMVRPSLAPWAPVFLAVYLVGVATRAWWAYRHRYAATPLRRLPPHSASANRANAM